MKYFKLVDNNTIIGIAASNNFVRYSPLVDCYLSSDELRGEYVNYKGKFYRSGWMQPYTIESPYQEVAILEITEEQYNIFKQAFETQDTIENAEEIDVIPDPDEQVNPIDRDSIEFVRQSKINEMSYACRKAIESGIDLQIQGENRHFSLTTQDQLNLMTLSATGEGAPYHADGQECTFYSAEEIQQLMAAMNKHKTYHTTYYNSLKNYINSLQTIEEIAAITYGIEIPDEYKSEVLKVIE